MGFAATLTLQPAGVVGWKSEKYGERRAIPAISRYPSAMSESHTITCPECNTEQSETAPFCQNCGYRMRSPETVREPMTALSGAESDSPSPDHSSEPDRRSSPKRRDGTTRPNRDMISTQEDDASGRTGSSAGSAPTPQGSETVLEGMQAVSTDDDDGGESTSRTRQNSDAGESSPPASPQHLPGATTPMDQQRWRIRWIVGATLLGCVGIVVGLSWFHLDRQEQLEHTTEIEPLDRTPIEIDQGRFRRGLSDDAEAFILEFCFRYHDEPERDCNRDRLLAGEVPQQTVEMPAYRIDATPVTNSDYDQCVDAGDCAPIDYADCEVWTPKGLQSGVRVPEVLRAADRPVVCATRNDAVDFCRHQRGALPTHNQWEKAARGDRNIIFPWGNRWEPARANWGEMDVMRRSVAGELDGWAWTSPPGAFPEGTSPYDVHDMAGNVAEWIRDDDNSLEGYVRGGSWVSNPFELRTTAREQLDADARRTDVGFRCVYTAE